MTGPILLLDSGVGGLTVLAAVRALLPDAAVVYCADWAGFPYGARREADVSARVAGLLGRLVERVAPSLAVIACNTASTIALDWVRPVLPVPVVGTVPAIKPAAERSRTRAIGVLGTEATIRQPYVDDLVRRFAADCVVVRHAAPELVQAAEAKLRGQPVDARAVEAALGGILDAPRGAAVDTIVLACTHFPLLRDELAAAAPPGILFLDGATGIARRVVQLLDGTLPPPGPGRFLATAAPSDLAALAPALHRLGLDGIEILGEGGRRW